MLLRKPLSGAILGILIGVAIAVILSRQGVWPPDQLTLFLLPAVTGILGMLLLSIGRHGSNATLVVALVLLVPMAVWGALGFTKINQSGELNGGCTVDASSDLDTTTVIDTSRSDPFRIDPDGALTWTATSPEVFTDYRWEIYAVLGGIPVPVESGEEANDAGDLENGGDVADVGAYASERGINLDLYVGVHEVGGAAATCDGFGFVYIVGDGVDVVTVIASALAVLLLIILLVLFYPGRRPSRTEGVDGDHEEMDDDDVSVNEEPGSTDVPETDRNV